MVIDRSRDYIIQLSEYIKNNLSKGYTLDSLRISLGSQGYSRIAIEKAINLANKDLAEKAPVMKEKPAITYKVSPIAEEDYKKKEPSLWKRILKKLTKK